MNVWMQSLTKGAEWHTIAGRSTVCGLPIETGGSQPGDTRWTRGHVLGRIEAGDVYAARQCRACSGDAVRYEQGGVA